MESDRIDGVDLVLAIEVGVERIHHHDEFLPVLRLGIVGVTRAGSLPVSLGIGVDDECAVQALVDVSLEWNGMAVVEVTAVGIGIELIGKALARLDHTASDPGYPIHESGVNTVEVDGVRMCPGVGEVDPNSVALSAAERRSWNLAIVGPGREEDAWGDLDLLVGGDDLVLAKRPAIRLPAHVPVVECGEEGRGIEAHGNRVDLANGHHHHGTVFVVSGLKGWGCPVTGMRAQGCCSASSGQQRRQGAS